MAEESKKYTAFAVPGSGLWQFRRMPFGLTNAPQTFQRLIDQLFGPELEPFVFGYLDDIIIVTEGFEEHLKWVEVVVTRLVVAGLTVNRGGPDPSGLRPCRDGWSTGVGRARGRVSYRVGTPTRGASGSARPTGTA